MCSDGMASAHVILRYVNQTKIKSGCQSGRKVVAHNSKSDLPLVCRAFNLYEHFSQVFWYMAMGVYM